MDRLVPPRATNRSPAPDPGYRSASRVWRGFALWPNGRYIARSPMAAENLAAGKEADRPTRVRFGVLAFLCALAFVLYIDRICISKAAPQIEAEFGISHTAMGFVF